MLDNKKYCDTILKLHANSVRLYDRKKKKKYIIRFDKRKPSANIVLQAVVFIAAQIANDTTIPFKW